MPLEEFNAWFTRYQLKPFGDRRGDIRIGILASVLANIHRDPKTRSAPYEASDFMPVFLPEIKRPQTIEEQVNIMLYIQAGQAAILAARE